MRGGGSKLFMFLMGLILGIFGTAGGLVALGYYAYNNLTIKQIEDMTGTKIEIIDQYLGEDSIFRFMSAKQMVEEAAKIPDKTLAQFSEHYGISFPNQIKFLTDPLKDVKIGQLISGATLDIMLTQIRIGDIFGSPYSDVENYPYDYTGAPPEGANMFIWELRRYTVMGDNGVAGYLNNVTLGSLRNVYGITLPAFMDSLEDSIPVSQLGEYIDDIPINAIISDPMSEPGYDPETAPFSVADNMLHMICTMTYTDPDTAEEKPYTLGRINQLFPAVIDQLRLQDIMDEPSENSTNIEDKILRRIWEDNPQVTDMTGALANTIGTLTRGDLFSDDDNGFMSLIPADTPINEIGSVMESTFPTITLGKLSDAGLINEVTHPDLRNMTLDQVIKMAELYISMMPPQP